MATKAAPIIGASRPRLAGDIVWLGFTGFVLALLLGIMCWPLSAELSPRNTASAEPAKPTATLPPGAGTGSAATASLPAFAAGTSKTRLGASMTLSDDTKEGSSSPAPTEQARAKLSRLNLEPPSAKSASPTSAAHNPAAHRLRPHHPRVRPHAPEDVAQLTPPADLR
jgi:hypothetical protein